MIHSINKKSVENSEIEEMNVVCGNMPNGLFDHHKMAEGWEPSRLKLLLSCVLNFLQWYILSY